MATAQRINTRSSTALKIDLSDLMRFSATTDFAFQPGHIVSRTRSVAAKKNS
jgi:hypothetical protein